MPEQFTNGATTTLAATLNPADNSMSVTGPIAGSPPFPATGTFRVRVVSTGELIKVVGVSGTTWDVTGGRADGGSTLSGVVASGATIEQDLTKEALDAAYLRADKPVTQVVTAQGFQASGIGAFGAPGRFLGALAVIGPPTGGPYATGDCGLDINGALWVCTAGGSPGTWRPVGPLKVDDQTLGASAASVTIPQSGSFPTAYYSQIQVIYQARGDTAAVSTLLLAQLSGDTGANYDSEELTASGAASSAVERSLAATSGAVADISAANAPAGEAAGGTLWIPNYNGTTFRKKIVNQEAYKTGDATGNQFTTSHGFTWRSTAAVTSIKLMPAAGLLVTGSRFVTILS